MATDAMNPQVIATNTFLCFNFHQGKGTSASGSIIGMASYTGLSLSSLLLFSSTKYAVTNGIDGCSSSTPPLLVSWRSILEASGTAADLLVLGGSNEGGEDGELVACSMSSSPVSVAVVLVLMLVLSLVDMVR